MKYQELLESIAERKNIPTSVMLLGRNYRVGIDKYGDVIDYYCGGDALSEVVSRYYLQKQAELELTPVNKVI